MTDDQQDMKAGIRVPLVADQDLGSSGPVLSRRAALGIFGSVSMAAALGLTPSQVDRALLAMETLENGSQPGFTPKFFKPAEWRLVRILSDYVIPRDARSGSATDAKVPEYMDFLMSDREATEASRTAMRGGLAWMNNESRRRFRVVFASASDPQRRAILDDIAYPAKARPEMSQGVAFFNRFRDLTASGFFSSQMGWKDLRYIGNVSNPVWEGCPPAALAKLGVSYDLMDTRVPPSQ